MRAKVNLANKEIIKMENPAADIINDFQATMAKLRDYHLLEHHRLATFKNWAFGDNATCSAAKLAEAGFYYTGEEGTVSCFVCNKTLDGWEDGDNPWIEHSRHAPQCLFVKFGIKENNLPVENFLDILSVVLQNRITSNANRAIGMIERYGTNELNRVLNKRH